MARADQQPAAQNWESSLVWALLMVVYVGDDEARRVEMRSTARFTTHKCNDLYAYGGVVDGPRGALLRCRPSDRRAPGQRAEARACAASSLVGARSMQSVRRHMPHTPSPDIVIRAPALQAL